MSPRRILLIVLLVALGICALSGVFILTSKSDQILFQVLGSAIATAVGAGIMLPLTLLIERPRLRLSGIVALSTIALVWTHIMALIWVESPWRIEEVFSIGLGLSLVMGIPAALGALLISFNWARIAVPRFIVVAVGSWLICEFFQALDVFINYSSPYYDRNIWSERGIATGLILYGMGTCACALLINAKNDDRRLFRPLGIITSVLATLLAIFMVWSERTRVGGENLIRLMVLLIAASIVMAHVNLILMARLRQSQNWLRLLTMMASISSGVCVFAASIAENPFDNGPTEQLIRLAVAAGIAAGSGSVALIVLSMFNRKAVEQLVPGALTATQIAITCPRCGTGQTLPFGDSTCKICELQFSIKITESRCPGCGYLLYQLTSNKCPECGAVVREGETPPAPIPAPAA